MRSERKPLLIFDGDCVFCRTWIDHWKTLTGDAVDYAPYQEVADRFPEIPETRFRRAVQFVAPDGGVRQAADAVFATLALARGRGAYAWAYRHVPLFARVSEAAYKVIAGHRPFAAKMTRLLWGRRLEKAEFVLSRWVFLRALGILYAIAFLSYLVQLKGLIGSNGILPAADYLAAIAVHYGATKYWLYPTVAWLDASDPALVGIAIAGIVLSLLVMADLATLPALILLYVAYLSLFTVGSTFLSFQWDTLLLEMGFLAIWLAPSTLLPGFKKQTRPSDAVRWLFWLLLFRLIWDSGLVKIFSGDPSWRNLTALSYHYFTQPIPNPLSWYMHQLSLWFHKAETFIALATELAVPFLLFAPRRARFLGAWIIIAFQAFLELTGNYTAFNLQAIALCLFLFDDQFYRRFFPKRAVEAAKKAAATVRAASLPGLATAGMCCLMFLASGMLIVGMATGGRSIPAVGEAFYGMIEPFHLVNPYGAFAVMTTTRPEVVIEGSDNGVDWKEYGFKYKAGDVMRPPPFIAPHHPRLDWQMWFLQFGPWQQNLWFYNLMVRLLQGSPEVLALFATNPFPAHPPTYVRALLYDYRFTTAKERRDTGAWWHRELRGVYFPMVTLETLPSLFDASGSSPR